MKLGYKKPKSEVDYSKGMASAHCSICTHFLPPSGCDRVAGKIEPAYWCKLFKRRAST